MEYNKELSKIQSELFDSYKSIKSRADTTYSVFTGMKDRALEVTPENSKSILRDYQTSIKEIQEKKNNRLSIVKSQYIQNLSKLNNDYKIFQEQESKKPVVVETPEVIETRTETPLNVMETFIISDKEKCYVVTPNGKDGSQIIKGRTAGVLSMGRVMDYKFNSQEIESNTKYDIFELSPDNCSPSTLSKSLENKFRDKNIQRGFSDAGVRSKVFRRSDITEFFQE